MNKGVRLISPFGLAQIVTLLVVGSAPVAFPCNAQGYKRAQYVEGGIFLWADHGRALGYLRGRANNVNPGNAPYLSFLDRKRRASE